MCEQPYVIIVNERDVIELAKLAEDALDGGFARFQRQPEHRHATRGCRPILKHQNESSTLVT